MHEDTYEPMSRTARQRQKAECEISWDEFHRLLHRLYRGHLS